MNTDTNEMDVFLEDLDNNMKFLGRNINSLSERDQDFANSLCEYYEKRGYLSDKQRRYALAFWRSAMDESNERVGLVTSEGNSNNSNLAISPLIVPRPSGSKLIALFDKAAESGVAYVHAKYHLEGKSGLVIYRTGEKSREPGSIRILYDTGTVADKIPLASIGRDGRLLWQHYAIEHTELSTIVVAILREPAAVIASKGRQTGVCCYCSRTLTDTVSVKVGYGPICAEKYGLPHEELRDEIKLDVGLE